MILRAALLQLCAGDDPEANLRLTDSALREAANRGATLALTPECTNILAASRERQAEVLCLEGEDPTLARLRSLAREFDLTIVAGSLAFKAEPPETRFVNRCLVIGPDGSILARYDKIHMFDVTLDAGETYRESAAYRPGDRAVTVQAAGTCLGLSICYDLRFPALFRDLALGGARILTIPAAFTVPTGAAHWHVLLRARAIETGCFVLAPAQTGDHPSASGRPRRTYGHSLAVSPWGEVLTDAGTDPGLSIVELDLEQVDKARARIPALSHIRSWQGPDKTRP